MPRWFAIPLLLLMLLTCCCAAAEDAPLSLPECDTIEEVEAFILYPPEDGLSGVQAGYIRLISQYGVNDPMFRKEYWLGGEKGSALDLTQKENNYGQEYTYHFRNMCTRAAYSMAMSYLGIDVTPGGMSAMTGKRDLNPPYNVISEMVGVEQVEPKSFVFDTMVENYLTDPTYSPVYVYLQKPDGGTHALIVIAKLPEAGRYLVLDPAGVWTKGVQHRIYMISFNKARHKVLNSTFRSEYVGSEVLQLYQWRLVPQETEEAP